MLMRQALAIGETGLLLAAFPDESRFGPPQPAALQEPAWSRAIRRRARRAAPPTPRERASAGPAPGDDPLRGTWTAPALGPGFAACFVAREAENGSYELATSYDCDPVVESALLIMARLPPLAQPAR